MRSGFEEASEGSTSERSELPSGNFQQPQPLVDADISGDSCSVHSHEEKERLAERQSPLTMQAPTLIYEKILAEFNERFFCRERFSHQILRRILTALSDAVVNVGAQRSTEGACKTDPFKETFGDIAMFVIESLQDILVEDDELSHKLRHEWLPVFPVFVQRLLADAEPQQRKCKDMQQDDMQRPQVDRVDNEAVAAALHYKRKLSPKGQRPFIRELLDTIEYLKTTKHAESEVMKQFVQMQHSRELPTEVNPLLHFCTLVERFEEIQSASFFSGEKDAALTALWQTCTQERQESVVALYNIFQRFSDDHAMQRQLVLQNVVTLLEPEIPRRPSSLKALFSPRDRRRSLPANGMSGKKTPRRLFSRQSSLCEDRSGVSMNISPRRFFSRQSSPRDGALNKTGSLRGSASMTSSPRSGGFFGLFARSPRRKLQKSRSLGSSPRTDIEPLENQRVFTSPSMRRSMGDDEL